MTEIDWTALEADREAGTPGPWGNGKTGDEQKLILGQSGAGKYVCNVQIFQTPRHMGLWEEDGREANARRIARLPELEAYAIAARKKLEAAARLAEVCDSAFDGIDATGPREFYLALAAWDAAQEEAS